MRRAFRTVALCSLAVVLTAGLAPAQVTTVYTTNGFESPFTAGSILFQQGYLNAPLDADSGRIQTGVVRTGSQAFQAVGPNFAVPGFSGSGANFWYVVPPTFTSYNPVAAGKPFVQARFSGLRDTSGFFDIPFAGIYLEGKTAAGTQQALATVMVGSQGQLTVSTNAATGGSTQAVSTPTGLFGANQWHDLFTEMNFGTQTFRVYREGNPDAIQFQTAGGAFITDVPFRNTFGATVSIDEIGMLAYNFSLSAGSELAPFNNFYVDDYIVTASPSSMSPVPEPGLILATAAIGLGVVRLVRRRRATAAA